MHAASFPALPENERVWFDGAPVPSALLAASAAAAARLHGGEWLRPYFDRDDWETGERHAAPGKGAGDSTLARSAIDRELTRYVIDFPPALEPALAERAGEAWEIFRQAGGRLASSGEAAELRIALAKLERAFVVPARVGRLRWRALDATALPGRGLLVLARDDEFIAAVAGSRWCDAWRRATNRRTSAKQLRAFPLPWAPGTLRSALTREQEERRDAVVRAWRGGDGDEELDGQVAAAYGWRASIEAEEALEKLQALHGARLSPSA